MAKKVKRRVTLKANTIPRVKGKKAPGSQNAVPAAQSMPRHGRSDTVQQPGGGPSRSKVARQRGANVLAVRSGLKD